MWQRFNVILASDYLTDTALEKHQYLQITLLFISNTQQPKIVTVLHPLAFLLLYDKHVIIQVCLELLLGLDVDDISICTKRKAALTGTFGLQLKKKK